MTRPQVAAQAAKRAHSATTQAKQAAEEIAKQASPNTAAAQSKLVAASRKNRYKAYCEQLYMGMPHSARMPSARVKTAALAAGCPRITHELGQVANVYAYKTLVMVNAMALEIANLDRATRVNEKHVLKAMLALEVPVDCLREHDTFAPLFDEQLDAPDRATSFADSPLDDDQQYLKNAKNAKNAKYKKATRQHQASAREQYVQHIARTHLARIRGLRLGPLAYDQDQDDQDDKAGKAEKQQSRKRARGKDAADEPQDAADEPQDAMPTKRRAGKSKQSEVTEFDLSDISDDDSDEEHDGKQEEDEAESDNETTTTTKAKKARRDQSEGPAASKPKKDKDKPKKAKKDKTNKKKGKYQGKPEWAQLDALMSED